MKIVVSADELKIALGEWLARAHPGLAGKSCHIRFDYAPLTENERIALDCGMRLDYERGVQATIETVDA
jgi:hypothetical protein